MDSDRGSTLYILEMIRSEEESSPKETFILTLYKANSVNEGISRQSFSLKQTTSPIIRSHTGLKLQNFNEAR